MQVFFGLLLIYLLVLVVAGWWFGRGESEEEYLIAGRDRSWWQVAFSKYATTIGAAWFVTYTAFAYEYGISVLTLVIGVMVGYLFFAFWGAPRIKKLSTEMGGFYTMGDLVRKQTGSVHSEVLLNILVLIATFLYLTVGVVAGGILMEQFGLVSYEIAIFLTFFITIMYVLMSGYKAVVLTDVIQGVVLLSLLCLVVWGLFSVANLSVSSVVEARPISWLTILMFAVFGVVTTFASSDRYLLSYAGKDEDTLKRGFASAFIPVGLTAIALILVGSIMFVVSPNIDSGAAFPLALTEFLPITIVPFALVMFFAGLMSSVDTNLYVLASHLKPGAQNRLTRTKTRIRILSIGLVSVSTALIFRNVVDLTILAASLQVVIAFPMIYLVAGGRKKTLFLYTIYGGLVGAAVGIYVFGLDPQAAAFVLIGNILGWTASTIVGRLVKVGKQKL